MSNATAEQLTQLEVARNIVLDNPLLLPEIVAGVLPIVGVNARVELRRWGANFLAETFASPVVSTESKQQLGITVLQTLKELLDAPGGQDVVVLQGVIQASASIYGFIFKYIIDNPIDIPVWNHMAAIKSSILKGWDLLPTDAKVCSIKFVQKVVQVQTPGATDPRRPEHNETSIAIVPKDHPLIPPSRLEPEASGLLDRLLDTVHQDSSDPVLITATLNCLPILIRTRQSIANKILSAILNFNPLKRANSPMTPTLKVQIKSLERTTRALLLNYLRRSESSPLAPRIKQYVDRMQQSRMEIFNEGASKKRGAPIEPTDGLDASKRRKMGAEVPARPQGVPLNLKGPNTLAQVFTLTNDTTLASFDVQQLPQQLAVSIANGLLAQVDQANLHHAVSTVRARLLSLEKAALPPALGDDEEDYEPAFAPSEDAEQFLNRTDALPVKDVVVQPIQEIALGPFKLSQPPPFGHDEAIQIGRSTVNRVFGTINSASDVATSKRKKQGINRLAGSSYDRDAWITFVTRLATRGSLETYSTRPSPDSEPGNLSDTIRDNLWRYVMEDFRARINTAIAWLNEEWFNDRMQVRSYEKSGSKSSPPNQYYESWALKILESIMPYLDAKDKLLIRFLSEIPEVGERIVERVKSLAKDPERVDLCVKALYYLVLMKPPARELCLNALEDLWKNYDDARAPVAKLLPKWRPHLFPPASTPAPDLKPAAIPQPPPPIERPPSGMGIKQPENEIKSPINTVPLAAAG